MAAFRKLKSGRWRVEVCRGGIRVSRTFTLKSTARSWAAQVEAEIEAGKYRPPEESAAEARTFGDLLKRYSREVTPKKRGARWEQLRIGLLLRDKLSEVPLSALDETHISDWRDRRLQSVSPASVSREMSILSNACRIAMDEWKWIDRNPVSRVRRPAGPPPRQRRITDEEIEAILVGAGYTPDAPPETLTARVGAAFLFAIETAMRAGEICSLTWDNIDERTAHLPRTKNNTPRTVPLSSRARQILDQLRPLGFDTVFGLKPSQLDALFRKVRDRSMIEDLHFHDTRREALTRL
ncbi:MAG: site-specific integrase, partial [Gammaproteobacteria bacterium]